MSLVWSNFGVSTFNTATSASHGSDINSFIFESDGVTVNAYHGYAAVALMTRNSSSTYWDARLTWWSESFSGTGSKLINYTTSKYSYQPKAIWVSPHEILITYHIRDDGTFCRIYNIDTDTLSSQYTIETYGTNSWSYPQGHGGIYLDEYGILHISIGTRNSSGYGITIVAMHYPEDPWGTWTTNIIATGTLQYYNATTLLRRKGYLWLFSATTYGSNILKLGIYKKAVSSDPGTAWTLEHETVELPYSEVSNKYKVTSMSSTLVPPAYDVSGIANSDVILVELNKWYSSSSAINYRPMICRVEIDVTDDESVDAVVSEYAIDNNGGADPHGIYRTRIIADQTGGAYIIGYTPNSWGPADGKSRVRQGHNPNVRSTTWASLANTGWEDIGPIEDATYEPNHIVGLNPEISHDGNVQSRRVFPEIDPYGSSAANAYGLNHNSRQKVVVLNTVNNTPSTRTFMKLADSSGPTSSETATPALLGAKQQCVSWSSLATPVFTILEESKNELNVIFSSINGNTNIYRELEGAWIRMVLWFAQDEPPQTGKPYMDLSDSIIDTGWMNAAESKIVLKGQEIQVDEPLITRIFVSDSAQLPKLNPSNGGMAYVEIYAETKY